MEVKQSMFWKQNISKTQGHVAFLLGHPETKLVHMTLKKKLVTAQTYSA